MSGSVVDERTQVGRRHRTGIVAQAVPGVRRWIVVFVGAAVVRIGYWLLVLPDYVPGADADQYRRLGQSLASGGGFQLVYPIVLRFGQADGPFLHPTAFRPPLYPALLAPGFAIFGESSLWPARLTSVVLGSLVAVLAGVLAARSAGRTAGLVAACATAVYPPLLANDTVLLTEPLALVLVLGALLLADARQWSAAGLVLGLLALTRPNVYLVIVILAVWAWRSMGARRGLALVGVTVLVVAPWVIRNQIQVHAFRPTTSDGLTLAAVYGDPGRRANTFVDPVFSGEYGDPGHVLARNDEARWNAQLAHEGLAGLKHHPSYAWVVVRRNFRGYFELDTDLNRLSEQADGRDWQVRQNVLPAYWAITAGGLIGVGLGLRRRNPLLLATVLVTTQFVLLSLALVAPPRLRAAFDVTMCIGVGLLAAEAVSWRRRTTEG